MADAAQTPAETKNEYYPTVSPVLIYGDAVLLQYDEPHGQWLLPTTHIAIDETPMVALYRHVQILTGIAEQHLTTLVTYADNFSLERDDSEGVTQPLPFDLDIHAVGTNGHHHVDSAYALVSKTDELTPQTDEPIKLQWFSGEDAAALIATTRITISRVQYALARHQDAPPEHE